MSIKIHKIKEMVDKICSGNFSCSDVGLLFILLRPILSPEPILVDLANFVTHGDEKDRGISFKYIHSYVENFIKVSEHGGTIFCPPPVFNKEKVVESLIKILKSLDLSLNENKLREEKDVIVNYLLELMEETEFRFEDSRIVRCYLRRDGQKIMFCLNLNLTGPFIKIPPSMTIQANLFS